MHWRSALICSDNVRQTERYIYLSIFLSISQTNYLSTSFFLAIYLNIVSYTQTDRQLEREIDRQRDTAIYRQRYRDTAIDREMERQMFPLVFLMCVKEWLYYGVLPERSTVLQAYLLIGLIVVLATLMIRIAFVSWETSCTIIINSTSFKIRYYNPNVTLSFRYTRREHLTRYSFILKLY